LEASPGKVSETLSQIPILTGSKSPFTRMETTVGVTHLGWNQELVKFERSPRQLGIGSTVQHWHSLARDEI
jgi:hypothetical protein